MSFTSPLTLHTVLLKPGQEWTPQNSHWRLIRVASGPGYWFGPGARRELAEGDVVLVSPKSAGLVRASQIGEMQLQFFAMNAEALVGVLTAGERRFLETQKANPACDLLHFARDTEVARTYAQLVTDAGPEFSRRGLMLHAFGAALPRELIVEREEPPSVIHAQDRFNQIIARLPESELLKHTPEELARQCGCSLRHFRRLFQRQYGQSIRTKQTCLRLEKARHLLQSTDSKVIHVAFDVGYRHLGLFNSMFKRQFGMTPTEWRMKAAKKPAAPRRPTRGTLVATLLFGWLLALATVSAQPGAGPKPSPTSAVSAPVAAASTNAPARTFEVRAFEVSGNTLLPQPLVDAILTEFTGGAVTLENIRVALGALSLKYRERGFVTVSVSLPPQQLTNGVVKVQVTEGRLAEINVIQNGHFSSNNVLRALPSLRTGILLNSLVFQQELDRANASRDRQIYPQVGPGPEPGTSSLTLKVKDRLPLHGRIGLDNNSTPGTPNLRVNSAIQYNNLWQREHQVGLSYGFSPELMKIRTQPLTRFWDQPLIANYSLFYRAPLALGRDERGSREYRFEEFGYDEVNKRFRPPPMASRAEVIAYASKSTVDSGILSVQNLRVDTGTSTFTDETFQQNITLNENIGARLMLPLPDFGKVRSSLSAGFDFKRYRLAHYETNQISDVPKPPAPPAVAPPPTIIANPVPGAQPQITDVDYIPFTVSWDGSMADKRGFTALSLSGTANFASLLDRKASFARASYHPDATGNYVTTLMSLTRDHRLHEEWFLRVKAEGQWASQPLISNEQFGLGGQAGPRGYQDGTEYGDTGWRMQIEPRAPPIALGMADGTIPVMLRLSCFYDYGQRYLVRPAFGRARSESLSGAGALAILSIGDKFDFRVQYAQALDAVPGNRSGKSRLTFGLAWQF